MAIIKEQEDVVNSRNKNIIVSASAGSGKTTVMIRRIVELIIKDDVNLDELLVLTYTKAAASEMKQKLITKMGEKVEEKPALREQIENISLADISTFDSFCQKLVKKYFFVLGIDPTFSIISGSEEKELQQKAVEIAVSKFKKQNTEEFANILDFYASNRTEKDIKNIVMKIFQFSLSILDYEEWKNSCIQFFENGQHNKATQIVMFDLKNKLAFAKNRLDIYQQMANNYGLLKYVTYINKLQSKLFELSKIDNFGDFLVANSALSFDRIMAKDEKEIFFLQERIKIIKEYISEKLKSYALFGEKQDYITSLTQCKQTTLAFLKMCDLFVESYTLLKKRKNVYDYNDIERLVIKLLSENAEICQSIKNKYKYIFVDEFQDANKIQENIINLIKKEDNVFYVGDLKQAIYGFRQSNSEIFENIAKQFEFENQSEAHNLNCNFRSNPEVLTFVNNIFCTLMTENTAHLDYKEKSQLKGEAKFLPENCNVCLAIINQQKNESASQSKLPQYSVKQDTNFFVSEKNSIYEARYVAQKIAELKLQQIYDINLQQYRNVEFSDITILLRKRGEYLNEFIEELARLDVPISVNTDTKTDETYDAEILTDLIYVAQNYQNDFALASVMMSDLFDFSAQEMSKIRQTNKQTNYFYECVDFYRNENDDLANKINAMFDNIQEFETNARFLGLSQALQKIVIKTNYMLKISKNMAGYNRPQNVKNFINSFVGTNFEFDLEDFISYSQNSLREQRNIIPPTNTNLVNITTMHSSKGLEYPIVFVVNLGDNFNKAPEKTDIKLSSDYGIGVKYFNKDARVKYNSVFYNAIDIINKQDDMSEKIRLLYVALTRAKNKLFLVGSGDITNFDTIESDNEVFEQTNYLSQIVGCLPKNEVENISSAKNFNMYNNQKFYCEILNKTDLLPFNQNSVEEVLYDESVEINNTLASYITKSYFNKEATKIAEKNSVSELAKDEYFSSINHLPENLSISEHNPIKNKDQIGSLYHRILEICDFSDASIKNIENCIKKIKSEHSFDDDIFYNIDKQLILKNIQLLSNIISKNKVLKEQKFVMQIPYCEVQNSNISDKVLVQGVCDLVVFGDNNEISLIDYKFSSLSDEGLICRYKKQLFLYKKALSFALKTNKIKCFILSIKKARLLEIKGI